MEKIKIQLENSNFEIENKSESSFLVNAKEYNVRILHRISKELAVYEVNNRNYLVCIESNGKYSSVVFYKNIEYNVEIIDATREVLNKFLHTTNGTGEHKQSKIKAPMPGLVVKIPIEVGKSVHKGDTILIIEAMKMENAIKSPIDGEIANIYVQISKSVNKGEDLIEIK